MTSSNYIGTPNMILDIFLTVGSLGGRGSSVACFFHVLQGLQRYSAVLKGAMGTMGTLNHNKEASAKSSIKAESSMPSCRP